MKISISQPVSLLQEGNRDLNEDYIFPSGEKSKRSTQLFVVADGLGGKGKGEIAAKMATDIISDYILQLPADNDLHQEELNAALLRAEKALREYTTTNYASLGMGTSLSLLYLGPGLVTMAWVGICPIYHYHKESGKLSRVNALSQEEKDASKADERIYGSHNPASFHLFQLSYSEVSQGDYFLICSEGLLEKISERELQESFEKVMPPENIINDVIIEFAHRESGNYACHMFQVISVGQKDYVPPKKSKSSLVPASVLTPTKEQKPDTTSSQPSTQKKTTAKGSEKTNQLIQWGVLAVIGLVAISSIGVFIYNKTVSKNTKYGTFIEMADKAQEVKDFDKAIEMYDSAFFATENPEERGTASQLKADAIAQRKANMYTVREYLRLAEANMEAEDYKAAVRDYENAIEVAQTRNPDNTPIPLEKVAEAKIKYGHALFKAEDPQKNYQVILDLYQSAFSMYEENEALTAPKEDYYDLAVLRAKEAKEFLKGERPAEEEGLMAERSLPNQTATRGLESQTRSTDPNDNIVGSLDALSAGSQVEETGNSNSSETTSPEKSLAENTKETTTSNGNKSSSDLGKSRGATQRKSTRSTARTTIPKGTPEQQYYLQQGKLAYLQAKNTGSYQTYQASISNLVAAEVARDGMASYYLAYMYHAGLGVPENPQMALKYAQESANKGWPSGYYLYAHILLERKNKVDSTNAKKALSKACQKGHTKSCNRLKLANR